MRVPLEDIDEDSDDDVEEGGIGEARRAFSNRTKEVQADAEEEAAEVTTQRAKHVDIIHDDMDGSSDDADTQEGNGEKEDGKDDETEGTYDSDEGRGADEGSDHDSSEIETDEKMGSNVERAGDRSGMHSMQARSALGAHGFDSRSLGTGRLRL